MVIVNIKDFFATCCKIGGIVALSALLMSCGNKTQKITNNNDEPAWVNDISVAKKETKSMVVAVGSAKILNDNMNYATNQAAMEARIQIAQTVNSKIDQVIKDMSQSDGLKISENSLQAAKQKVSANLQQTEIQKRWIDKKSNPQTLYVLVSMDKDAYDRALKSGVHVLGIDDKSAMKLSNTVEDLLGD